VLTGTVLNVIALVGVIMLAGIVVNNAIIILDYYGQLRKTGIVFCV
jgi:HAE1 family hydrophobic/amphiphilic exporter-1